MVNPTSRAVGLPPRNEPGRKSASAPDWRKGSDACAGMISAAATMSRTTAQPAPPARGLPGGAGGLGLGTIVIIGLISWYFGIDPSVLLNGAQILTGGATPHQTAPPVVQTGSPARSGRRLHRAVLGDTEDRWKEIFTANGRTYHPPRLRLYTRSEPTPCAFARSAMGPFYCPHDRRIYLDVAFFDDLQRQVRRLFQQHGLQVLAGLRDCPRGRSSRAERDRHSAAGDAAAAGVHEPRRDEPAAGARRAAGGLSRRHLGESARTKHDFLDPGDVDQALQTASAIGDDRLQKQSQGYVVPDAFTHGTSQQRKHWFLTRLQSGQDFAPAIRCPRRPL